MTEAARNIRKIQETFIASGSQYPVGEFISTMEQHLRRSPDPDMALINLLRFSEASVSKASLFNDLLHYPVQMDVLLKLFGHSQYFADILVRDPELFRWLTTSDSLVKPRTKEFFAAEAGRMEEMFQKPERVLDGLKRLYRREVLRVGARDILGEAALGTVTQELSHLADALVDSSCRIAERQIHERFNEPPRTHYAVMGLGKLGGSELNYSSDIDIIFVYGNEGEVRDAAGRNRTYHEYFNALAERLVQNLSQSSSEGHLYRVDTRLRPESGAGPLARSLGSFLGYYESRGEIWERQMLIKARPVAGDPALGAEFLKQLEPFIYPRTFFQHPAEAIARIKSRIESAIEGEENVKLRPGGIRDIEFIAQTLQLLNGGKLRSIRRNNTLKAIESLAEEGLLSDPEAQHLASAYAFLRSLEHRLQTMFNTQTHVLPEDVSTQTTLARRLGLKTAGDLVAQFTGHCREVRQIFDVVLSVGSDVSGRGIEAIIDGNASKSVVEEVLARYRLRDTRRASKNIAAMCTGSTLTGPREPDPRSREAFRKIAPDLFSAIAETPVPDMTLNNLAILMTAQKVPGLLNDERFRKFILGICSMSPRLSKGLARDPFMLESLSSDAGSLAGETDMSPSSPAYKTRRELRAGIRNILGFTGFDELTHELTEIADFVLNAVLAEELRKRRVRAVPLAIFALGKHGTREITFDSDLDLIFITDTKSAAKRDLLEKVATSAIKRLSAVSEDGKMYEVDARLRPEGKSSPLVVERAGYAKYLKERSSLWERQSLTRLRFVAGNKTLAQELISDIESHVYDSPLPPGWVGATVTMRRKIETRSRTRNTEFHDIKLGAGGMVDVEFLAQMCQLKFKIKDKTTLEVIKALGPHFLSVDEVSKLSKSYREFRELEKLMRVTLEEKSSVLPEGEKLELLARCYDRSTGESLKTRIAATMNEVRTLFTEISQRISL